MDLMAFISEEFGFEEEEIDAIMRHFIYSLNLDDWASIEFVDETEEWDENYLKLPTGRMVYFPHELIHKEALAQMD